MPCSNGVTWNRARFEDSFTRLPAPAAHADRRERATLWLFLTRAQGGAVASDITCRQKLQSTAWGRSNARSCCSLDVKRQGSQSEGLLVSIAHAGAASEVFSGYVLRLGVAPGGLAADARHLDSAGYMTIVDRVPLSRIRGPSGISRKRILCAYRSCDSCSLPFSGPRLSREKAYKVLANIIPLDVSI